MQKEPLKRRKRPTQEENFERLRKLFQKYHYEIGMRDIIKSEIIYKIESIAEDMILDYDESMRKRIIEQQLRDAELLKSSTGPGAFLSDEQMNRISKRPVSFKIGEWKINKD